MEGSGVVGLCRHDRNERLPLEAILWRAFPSPLALVMVLPFHFLASALVRPPETIFLAVWRIFGSKMRATPLASAARQSQ